MGADGFQPYYLRQGKSEERPRYAHSLELGVLAQTGLVGALLVFGAIGALLAAARCGPCARATPPSGAAAGAAGAVFAYWFLHGSVDWFWEFAGLGAPAHGHAGPGRRPGARAAARPCPGPPLPTSSLPVPALAAGGVAVAAGRGPAGRARGSPTSRSTARPRPGAARPTAPSSASTGPASSTRMSAQADLSAGTIALRLGRLDQAERAFRSARDREPENAYALLELGLIAAERDDRAEATALLRRVTRAESARRDRRPGAARRAARALHHHGKDQPLLLDARPGECELTPNG